MQRACHFLFVNLVVSLLLPSAAMAQVAIGPGAGGTAPIQLIEPTGTRTIDAFPGFLGGMSVTVGDVNGDGVADVIAAAGPGGSPHVRVFSGVDLSELASFFAYDPAFAGGVNVAAGDVDGDGRADIITAAGAGGGPHVQVFSGANVTGAGFFTPADAVFYTSVVASFSAYDPFFSGGVHVAAGDVNGDGRADIITGAGAGGGPHVQVFNGADVTRVGFFTPDDEVFYTSALAGFFAYDPYFAGGVYVAAGDLNGDGRADIITGAGPGGGPHVEVFSGAEVIRAGFFSPDDSAFYTSALAAFFAYDPYFAGGVRVAAGDVNGDGRVDIITGAGPGGGPHVEFFNGADVIRFGFFSPADPEFYESILASFFAPDIGSGVSVGSVGDGINGLRFTSALTTTFTVGSAGTFTVTTAGTPAPAITSTGTMPSGVTLTDNGDGTATLAGTPAAGSGGSYALNLTADNGSGTPATQTFTLGVNQAPAITSAAAVTFPVGAAATFTVTTSGFPLPAIARSGAALPAGVTWVDNGDGTGTLSGTAALGTGGTYALTFTASNSVGAPVVQTFTLTVNGAPAFTSANATTFTVGTPGSFTVTTVASPTAAIGVSGALPAGVTFVDNGDGTGTLSGTPAAGTGGARTLTFSATNGILPNGSQTFTLTVNQAAAITSAAAAGFTVGTLGSFTITTTGFPVPAIVRTGAALPAGVTFTDNGDGTATLSGTPAAGTNGTYALIFTATGSGPAAVQNFTLTVSAGPTITSAATTTFTVGSPGTFTVTTTGSPTPGITVSGSLPSGVTFLDNGNGTGTLSGTPAGGTGGSYAITFTATNGVLPNGTQAFTLNVNQAPAITSAAITTFTIGVAESFTVTTSGFPAPSLARGGVALPAGVTFVDNGNGTGTLSGTPAAGTGGTYAISFTATNVVASTAPQPFTLTVSGPPSITSASTTTFTVGTPGTFTVTAIGSPTPALTVSGSLPAGVTFVDNGDGTGTLSGTPAGGTGGTYAITFTAANGVLPNGTQAFTLNVNQAPTITSAASTTFTVGALGTFTVTTTGFPAATLTLGGAVLPAGVTFVDNGNGTGTLSGTPGAGTGGTYAITFTATNTAGATAPQPFTLTINQPPTITSAASAAFTVGVAGSFTVTTTGFPAPGITRTGVALPGGVTFTDNGDGTGTLSGTPSAGTAGSYAITFTAANGASPNAVQSFTLTVQQAPAITSAASTTFTVGTPGTFTVTTTGFPTPTVSQTGTLPAGVTFTPATRVLGGTATQTGAFPLVFTATNSVSPDATQNFTLSVVCPAITVTPLVMPDGLYQTVYAGVDFNQAGSTGTTFTWGATGLPAGLAIDANTGVVSGTATTTVAAGVVAVTVTDNFGCQGTLNTAVTIRPTTDPENYLGGVGNTQYVTGAPFPLTPHVAFIDDVKTGDNGPGALSVTFPATSLNGGTIVEGTADGTFTYTPAVAFAGPTDSFNYTLTDGNGVTNTGSVTINLSNVVWYVNSAGGAGDGRSHSPFNTLNAAATPSGSTHIIYVHTGGASTPGNLAMDAAQTVHGQGATFTLNGLTIGAGTRPTLSGTVTLADNTTVRAVNFATSAIPAMTASGVSFAQPVTIDQVNVTGGSSALSLTNVTATATGAVNVSNANFTNTTAAEVLISQGNIPVTLATTAIISSNAGRSVDVQNRTGGNVVFNGAITDTGQGIFLNINTGATITFNGGLALLTGANPGFTATGGGIVSTTQNNTTIVNTITTTTGTALNVANTTIHASGLTFRSISANGAANGIVLNNTGSLAGLTVTGNGGACTPGTPTCTGGRIQNTSGGDDSSATPVGTGIVLNNTRSVSLSLMRLDTHSNYAIRGTAVNGFSLASSLVDGANGTNVSTPFNDGSLVFHGVTGVSSGMTGIGSITNSTIQGGHQRNISIDNSVGTLNLTVNGNTIRRTSDAAGDDGFALEADTTANVTVAVTNNTFARHGGDHINLSMLNNAVVDATITGNTLHGNYSGTPEGNHPIGLGQGIFILGATFNGTFTYNISNNGTVAVPLRGNRQGGAIHVNKGSGTGTFSGTIQNNVIGDPAVIGSGSAEAFGIIVGARGAGGSHTTLINNNQVRQYFDRGIVLEAGEGSAALNAHVTNNTLSNFADAVNSLHGIHSDNGILAGDTNAVCLNISGNSVATAGNEPAGGADIRLRRGSSTTVSIPGIGGTLNADATTRLQTLNPTATTITVTGNGFSNIASCPIP